MRKITEIIIHCADTPNGKEFHAKDIDAWHRERGWQMIGYHWVICIDGTVEGGRSPEMVGSHAEGHNARSLGICLIGKDKFTPAQWSSLKALVDGLISEFNCPVIGHYEVAKNGKTCPNFDVRSWVADGYIPDDKNILKEMI